MLKLKSLFPRKGSVLVFSLVLLSFLLVAALSVAVVSVTGRKGSLATEKSSRSFQAAESGTEVILQKIYKGNFAGQPLSSLGSCSDDVISGFTDSGSYKVSFYDDNNNQLVCGDTTWREKVKHIKSEGVSGNTVRAISVAVAAPPQPGITGGCLLSYNSGSPSFHGTQWTWGRGCKSNYEMGGISSRDHLLPVPPLNNSCEHVQENDYACGLASSISSTFPASNLVCICVQN